MSQEAAQGYWVRTLGVRGFNGPWWSSVFDATLGFPGEPPPPRGGRGWGNSIPSAFGSSWGPRARRWRSPRAGAPIILVAAPTSIAGPTPFGWTQHRCGQLGTRSTASSTFAEPSRRPPLTIVTNRFFRRHRPGNAFPFTSDRGHKRSGSPSSPRKQRRGPTTTNAAARSWRGKGRDALFGISSLPSSWSPRKTGSSGCARTTGL
jgi:hypothetical protein